jgi:hypothetical protein
VLIEAVPGEALSVTVPILDGTGTAVTIGSSSGWSVLAQLRTEWASTEVLYTFTTAGGSPNASVTAGAAGTVVLTATATDTAAWQTAWTEFPPRVVGDLFVTDNTSVPHCIADLVVSLLPRVTRS